MSSRWERGYASRWERRGLRPREGSDDFVIEMGAGCARRWERGCASRWERAYAALRLEFLRYSTLRVVNYEAASPPEGLPREGSDDFV
ncbi:MAG: hypothetical protein AB7S38_25970, partial [Vulcanimicrobiota bacterium]